MAAVEPTIASEITPADEARIRRGGRQVRVGVGLALRSLVGLGVTMALASWRAAAEAGDASR